MDSYVSIVDLEADFDSFSCCMCSSNNKKKSRSSAVTPASPQTSLGIRWGVRGGGIFSIGVVESKKRIHIENIA